MENDMKNSSYPTDHELIAIATVDMLCSVRPNMREISVEFIRENKRIHVFVYFDRPPDAEDIDQVSYIETEMMSRFPEEFDFTHCSVHLPYPKKILHRGICVYRRYEPNPEPESVNQATLLVAANKAMLGRIHQNMREIDVEYNELTNKIRLLAYFDTVASDNQINDVDAIIAEMKGHFSPHVSWNKEIIILPFPARIPRKSAVYYRYEPWGDDGSPGRFHEKDLTPITLSKYSLSQPHI
jgi:hypothetical protein